MSAMLAPRKTREQLAEKLMRVEGKAEIIGGGIVHLPMTGREPSRAAMRISASLLAYEKKVPHGVAVTDGAGFLVNLPDRESFAPGAAFYVGPDSGVKFFDGAPLFAAEVRSEGDYGPAAERAMAEKRADYFAAGTRVVWDVDLRAEGVVRVFRASNAKEPAVVYRRGGTAEAEPALAGWTMPVDDLFA